MVIGHHFAWGHLGKTGGNCTLALFRLFPRIVITSDNTNTPMKHATFKMRESQVCGKRLVLNLRRLDAWTLSFAQHRSKYGRPPDHRPTPMWSPDEMADCTLADQMLSNFFDGGRFKIDRWLRTEFLTSDFLSFVSELTEIKPYEREVALRLGKINAGDYDHDLQKWLTPEQRERLYRNNPIWAELERELYHDEAV
jgi:hypothetical protein